MGVPKLYKGVNVDVDDDLDFDSLYGELGPRLWHSIYAFTGGQRELTHDVVAEAFVRTMEAGASVRDRAAYAYRIAFRLAAHELRQAPDRGHVPEVAVHDDQGLTDVLDALRVLSPSQRAAVYLRYQADLPIAEIARLMDTSAGAVRVHLFRGRHKLADLLGGGIYG
jgi:RNA polymerase sigma-70 factor, ECF subfamily